MQDSLFDQPHARNSDPNSSHQAAAVMRPGSDHLIGLIRSFVASYGPSTAYEIANAVAGSRYQHDSVRSACSRAGLVKLEGQGRSPGNRPCCKYAFPPAVVDTRPL